MSDLQDLEAAIQRFKTGQVPPVVLVYGDQDYLVKQAYDRLLQAAVPEELRAFNLEQLDGARAEPKAVLEAFEIMPMLPGPKAIGVPEARFFQSRLNGMELLLRARAEWERQDKGAALRHLGRVLALLRYSWEEAQGKELADFAQALETEASQAASGDWLGKALAQGLASDFPLPSAADESGEILEGLERSLAAHPQAPRCLLFAASSADARKKLYRFTQEKGLVLEFSKERRGTQISQTAAAFLRNLLDRRGLRMPSQVAYRFVSAYGQDLGLLEKELAKLEAFAHPRRELSEQDLEAVGSPHTQGSIFRIFELLGRKEAGLKEALPLLRALLFTEPAGKLLAQLGNEVRLLLLCRALLDEGKVSPRGLNEYYAYKSSLHPRLGQELPAGLGAQFRRLNPFGAYQAFQRCRAFSATQLRAVLRALLEADLRLKTSQTSVEGELERICLRLCGVEEVMVR